jgi:hypothetical protein
MSILRVASAPHGPAIDASELAVKIAASLMEKYSAADDVGGQR